MRILNRSYMDPPLGWVGYAPNTDYVVSSHCQEDFVRRCRDYCEVNKLPVGLLFHEQCIDGICRYAENKGVVGFFKEQGVIPLPTRLGLTFDGVVASTKLLADWKLKENSRFESQEEIDRRASICVNQCTGEGGKHVAVNDCQGCRGNALRSLIASIIKPPPSKYDKQLYACLVCGCALKVKVSIPIDVIHRNMLPVWNDQFPAWCWAKKSS